jgi:hypothetical protein
MMLLTGIMMIRNENDILEEVLSEHIKFCDHIFVLDGTNEDPDKSKEICLSFKNITYFRDEDLPPGYPRIVRDGCRQFLLDRVRDKYGYEGWVAVLHGDEIFVDDPRLIIKKYRGLFDALTLDCLLYFIHKEQEPFKLDPLKSVQEQIVWYAGPGWPEARLFKNKKGSNYKSPSAHGKVVPEGLFINYKTTFKIKHYAYRNPEHQAQRARDRSLDRDWSNIHYQKTLNNVFYFDERDFYCKWYRWISNKSVRSRINQPFLSRLIEDLAETHLPVSCMRLS